MKRCILLLICLGYSMVYSQSQLDVIQRDTLVSGKAFWTFFSSDVYLVLETKNDNITGIFLGEDIHAHNRIVGHFSLKKLKQNTNDNRIVFNSSKANEIIRINIGKNFNSHAGGHLKFYLYRDKKYRYVATMHIRNDMGIWKIFYQDISSEKTNEYCIYSFDFTLNLTINRIKESTIKTQKGSFYIYPKFEKK